MSEVTLEARLATAGFDYEKLEQDRSVVYMLDPDLRIIYCNRAWDEFATQNGGAALVRAHILGTAVLDVIPESLRAVYRGGFARACKDGQPWGHDYECSSPKSFRSFHMRVLPLADRFLLVENSLRIEKSHGPDRPVKSPSEKIYRNERGFLEMCAHCRRTRRIAELPAVWDWVPAYLNPLPEFVSHRLCEFCSAYYFSSSSPSAT
jgi:hypothetical protein